MEACHNVALHTQSIGSTIALVGHPNVGKSALFQRLIGRYVAISNYPGTTVELSHGLVQTLPGITAIDTPGIVTLPSRTEDEQVTTRVLLDTPLHAIVQVGDAKNACRTLLLTVQLAEIGVLEDSGYLPRLAVLSNRLFRFLGLNGQAVLPMVLGLGCVTMATMTTRILESKRERLLVILLLALAVPCSAQLGVVMGMLASISLTATLIWAGVVCGILLVVGWLAARLVPGERSVLVVELPPLRWPRLTNVVLKTLARLEWYVKEALPLFLLGTAIMFGLNAIGVLSWLIHAGEPLIVGWLGLPAEASAAFLLGFLRRDFAATGLFVMQAQGALTAAQVVVAMVTLTLFIPCIASVIMVAKELGARTAAALTVLIFPLAFLLGGMLNRALQLIGWGQRW